MGVTNERRIASIFKEGRGAGVTEEEKVLVLQGRDKAKKLAMTFFKTHNKCGGKLRKDLAEAIQNVLHPKDPSDASKILYTLTNQCRMELNKKPLRKTTHQKGGARPTVAEFRDRVNAENKVTTLSKPDTTVIAIELIQFYIYSPGTSR